MRRSVLLILVLLMAGGLYAAKQKKPDSSVLFTDMSRPYDVSQGLDGCQIALWASHGLYYNAEQDRWMWQRARIWTTVEDLFTSSFVAPYLVPMLEQAGATVFQPRAYVRPGYQTIYVRWTKTGKPRTTLRVECGERVTTYRANTSVGVGKWHYLCTVEKNDRLAVTGDGIEYRSIDEHTLGVSGYPRFMEAAYYWLTESGYTDSLLYHQDGSNHYLNDLVCRGKWVNLLNKETPIDLSLAFHTDAGAALNDSVIGTMAIYTKKDVCRTLADAILTQVVSDLQATVTPEWCRRELRNARYAETRYPEVPSAILELLSHQNYADMVYALNPVFRFLAARAVYKGIGRWLADRRHTIFTPQPFAPAGLRTCIAGDSIHLTWQPVEDPIEPTATPAYYVVYSRQNGGVWDNGTVVEDCSYSVAATDNVRYEWCVAAGNEGGISLRSSVVSALRATEGQQPILVIDAFPEVRGPHMMAFDSLTGGVIPGSRPIPDNYDMAYIGEQVNYNRLDPWHSDDDCGFGMCNTDLQEQIVVGNTHDYAARHGRVLQQIGRSYISCTMDAISAADSVYKVVDIVLGKSNGDIVRVMNDYIQRLKWTEGDKKILMSGAYIGYPHHACASGQIRLDGQTYSYSRELNNERLSAEDVSAVSKNAPTDTIIARYSDTGLPAIIQGTNYTLCGFPLETLDDFENIYQQLIIHL